MRLMNYSGTEFDLELSREVRLLSPKQILASVSPFLRSEGRGVSIGQYDYEHGSQGLDKRDRSPVDLDPRHVQSISRDDHVIPFKAGPDYALGPDVNDAYFGKVPFDRLVAKGGVLFFSGDGQYRSKIGISPLRAKPFAGAMTRRAAS